jgi:hypothetical protein
MLIKLLRPWVKNIDLETVPISEKIEEHPHVVLKLFNVITGLIYFEVFN